MVRVPSAILSSDEVAWRFTGKVFIKDDKSLSQLKHERGSEDL